MARAGKAHTSEDIWHLSIDDLLAAPKEPARLAGRGPFVINLSTSTASISSPPKGLGSFDGLYLYQLRRGPEGRSQFLLRLGIIATEVEADSILSDVLEHYPGATKDSAEDDDRAAVAAKARPAEPPKPAKPHAEKAPEVRRPPPKAAPPTPKVAAKPEEPFRWDIDEVLPDLAVTRPSRREREARKDSPPVVRPPSTGASRAQAPTLEHAPADTDLLVAAASSAPGNLSTGRKRLASGEPPTPPGSAIQHERFGPRESAPREPSALSKPSVQAKSESFATVATPSTEIEPSVPEPTLGVVEDFDCELDAITHEVEAPTFIFEMPQIEAPTAAAPKAEARNNETSLVQSHELDLITAEASTIDAVTAEAPTIEAHELGVITLETSTTEAQLTEAPTIGACALELLSAEAPSASEPSANEIHDLRVEQAALDATEPVAPSLPVAEPLSLDAQTPAASEPFAAGDLAAPGIALAQKSHSTATVAPAEEVPAFPTATRAPLDDVPVVAAAPARTDEANATNAVDAPASVAAASVPKPAKPVRPIVSSAIPRTSEPPSAPRVPAAESAPADALIIDSTQTVRALTPLELADDQASQWFSIQLALSEAQIDPEHVPSLDIFNEYRLYSVMGFDQDRVMHALRLGFFSSALAAEAVAGYLRGYFDSPSIKRVSLQERERFAEKGVTARKDIGATGMHAVIELAGPKPLPERHTQICDTGTRRAPRSVWSRLIAPLKR